MEPKKPDPNDTGKRRPLPPPPPNRPPARPGGTGPGPGSRGPGGGPPRPPTTPPGPATPRPKPEDDALDQATPRVHQGDSDEELMFMTHAPGASVAPRQMLEVDKEVKEFEERIKAKDAEKAEKEKAEAEKDARRKGTGAKVRPPAKGDLVGGPGMDAPAPAAREGAPVPAAPRRQPVTRRLVEGAGRAVEAAGVGAIQRTLQAGRTVQPAGPVVKGASFWSLLGGALAAPLRGGSIGAAAGGTLLLVLALLVVEVSPPVGLIACAVVAIELTALMVKHVRESGGGRDDAAWPTFGEAAGGFVAWTAAGVAILPALALAAVSYGPGAWDVKNPASVSARAGRVWAPPAEARSASVAEDLPGGDVNVPDAFGRHALSMLDAMVGPALLAGTRDQRSARELSLDLAGAAHRRARALAPPPEPTPLQVAWRVLLGLGLVLYPVAVIACARLKSAYAALHLPMLLRAVLRAPAAYLVVVLGWLVHLVALLGVLLVLPSVLHARLEPAAAHVAWMLAVALLGAPGTLVVASLLGRFYRSQAHSLAWE